MRANSIRIAVSLCVLAALPATGAYSAPTGAKKPVQKPVQKPAAKTPVKQPAVAKPTIKPIAPKPVEVPGQLVISPSAEVGALLRNSWPLIVSASLWRKALIADDKGNVPTIEPVTIRAKEGSWRDALVIEVKNASGAAVSWPLQRVKQPDQSLTLGIDDSASAEWWLEPADTQSLPEGDYNITVSFDPKLVDGLPENVQMDGFRLRVAKEPSPLDQDTQSEKQLQMAILSAFRGDAQMAKDLVDKLIKADPSNIGALRLRSRLLLHEGKKREAVSSLDSAMGAYLDKHPDACPPAGLLQERADILRSMPEPATEEYTPTAK